MIRIATLFMAILVLGSCTGSKHFTKMAQKQEAAGLLKEASENYYTALLRKRTNLDAQVGMKTTGQMVLNEKLSVFARAKMDSDHRSAVYSFKEASSYRNKISQVGVNLTMADYYTSDYEGEKNAYMTELYEAGTALLDQQKYTEAEVKFNEIKTLDPEFKDASELGDIAYLEPLYNEGVKSMGAALYRKAYNQFTKVVDRRVDYKDAKSLQQESLKKGTFTVALLSFVNATQTAGLDAKVNAYTLEALTSIKDPFLKVVDREHMQAILQEQKLQLSGVIDENTAVQVGNLVGAQALLTGTVLSYDSNMGRVRTTVRDGYEAYQVKKLNAEDGKFYYETKYRPCKYTEYYNVNSCMVTFQYKLISLQTGEILRTEIIEKEVKDEVLYAKSDIAAKDLYPSGTNGPNLNNGDRNSLMNMISGRQELRSVSDLSNDLFNAVSSKMSTEIGSVVMTIVQ